MHTGRQNTSSWLAKPALQTQSLTPESCEFAPQAETTSDALVVVDDGEGVALAESDALVVVDVESVGVALAETEALALVVAQTLLEEDMIVATLIEESARA